MSNNTEPIPSIDERVKSANSGTKKTISTKIRKQPRMKRASMIPALGPWGKSRCRQALLNLIFPRRGTRALS